jgi:methylthioxylose transferase
VTLGELGADSAARRAVPFVAIFPGAVWMAVSADGLFAGVATAGLALVCVGAARGRLLASLLGGLLLGTTLFLSYGLVLFGLVVLTALAVSIHQRGLRSSVGPVAGYVRRGRGGCGVALVASPGCWPRWSPTSPPCPRPRPSGSG